MTRANTPPAGMTTRNHQEGTLKGAFSETLMFILRYRSVNQLWLTRNSWLDLGSCFQLVTRVFSACFGMAIKRAYRWGSRARSELTDKNKRTVLGRKVLERMRT
jgi:hypothetical protein